VPKAEESVRSPASDPPPWSGNVVLMFLVVGTAPIELYEMVTPEEPLYVPPEATPDPPLLMVRLLRLPPKATPEIVEFVSPELLSVPESVGAKVKVPPEFVIVWPKVRPLKEAEEVAKVKAPVCALPYVCWAERTPVFEMVREPPTTEPVPERAMPEPEDGAEVAT